VPKLQIKKKKKRQFLTGIGGTGGTVVYAHVLYRVFDFLLSRQPSHQLLKKEWWDSDFGVFCSAFWQKSLYTTGNGDFLVLLAGELKARRWDSAGTALKLKEKDRF
jgi:hypothetical protein